MTNRSEIRKAHEIVDKIYPIHEREALRKLLPPRPEFTFGDAIQALKGLASEDDVHLWSIIRHLERLEKSYSQVLLKGTETLPIEDAPDTKPAHPEFLDTEADYREAPEGTIVNTPDQVPWSKEFSGDWVCAYGRYTSLAMATSGRRSVLRWGWGND